MKYDILSVHETAKTVKVEAGQVTSLKNADIQRYGTRRFEDGKVFQASRLGEVSQDRLITDTKEFGGPGVAHDYGFAPAHEETRNGLIISRDVLEEYEVAVRTLADRHLDFVFSGRCGVTSTTTKLASNYGLNLQTSGDDCDWYVAYQRKGSGNMMDGFVGEETGRPTLSKTINDDSEFINALKTEVKMKSGRIPVVMANSLEPLTKLTQSFAINLYKENACLYAGKLGETLFSSKFSLRDRAYAPEFALNHFFDGEGVVRAKDDLTLIDKGRFTALLSDLRFGKKFGQASTGNGLRAYNTGAQLGSRKLSIVPGQKPWREILRGIERCLIVVVAAGGDSNDLGEFSSPVQIGYVFEKGEIVGRAPQVTVKAAIGDYLGSSLIEVASDGFLPNWASPVLVSEMDVMVN